MINFNGELLALKDLNISYNNRGLKYGDSIFETIRFSNNKLVFFEDHYFRLMASMRMIRMKIPMSFTMEFLENEILRLINLSENKSDLRIRLTIFRKDGGLYLPKTNDIDYLIEANPIKTKVKTTYRLGLYKDFYNYSGLLSTIKTNNRMLNTVASIYAAENDFDNCILLNEKKSVVEVTNGNIFIINDNIIKTPALTEGCIKGVIRKKVIDIINNNDNYMLEETSISPFELQKAHEVFITNAVIGIQPVSNYRKKEFKSDITNKLKQSLKLLEITSK